MKVNRVLLIVVLSLFIMPAYHGEARYYDARVGRFLSIDPLKEKYPFLSPYVYVSDNPTRNVDPDGKKVRFANDASPSFRRAFSEAVKYLNEHHASGKLAELEKRKEIITLEEGNFMGKYYPSARTIVWDPNGGIITTNDKFLSPTVVLAHEVDHALQSVVNPGQYQKDSRDPDPKYDNKEEKRVIEGSEQTTARKLGEVGENEATRKDHDVMQKFKTTGPTSTEARDAIVVTPPSKDEKKP